jgi:hypothetical protein
VADPADSRWVIVVDAAQEPLYRLLVERLGDAATILLDRRKVERRRGSQGSPAERRRMSRRAQRALARVYVEGVAKSLLTAVVESPGAARLTPVDPAHLCPTCEAHIAFELPRFPHKPARVDTQIVHVQPPGAPPEHYVEIQAFTQTGRALLSERVRVHRRR